MCRYFVIIGLGRLGSAMLETLLSLGHEVLGIDSDEDLVQNLSGEFPHAHLIAARRSCRESGGDQDVVLDSLKADCEVRTGRPPGL